MEMLFAVQIWEIKIQKEKRRKKQWKMYVNTKSNGHILEKSGLVHGFLPKSIACQFALSNKELLHFGILWKY